MTLCDIMWHSVTVTLFDADTVSLLDDKHILLQSIVIGHSVVLVNLLVSF